MRAILRAKATFLRATKVKIAQLICPTAKGIALEASWLRTIARLESEPDRRY
jgi:hypothetical protein